MWRVALALLCGVGCGRIAFDERALTDAGDPACVGTTCGVQCVADCFPMMLGRGSLLPGIGGASLSLMPSGEVHVAFIDPASGAVMWQYSDATFRNWSAPVALSSGVVATFDSVELVRHADNSLTALVLDSEDMASVFYRRSITPVTAPAGTPAWAASGELTVLAAPLRTVGAFDAVADRNGLGGFVTAIDLGDGATIPSTVYVTRSDDKFVTLNAVTGAGQWESIRTSVLPMVYYEARIAVDATDAPWIYYHERTGSTDDGAVLRYSGGSWMRALPGWGDPWHAELFVDSTNLLHVIYEQEGTTGNPQHATVTSLTMSSGGVSIGNWDWASLPPGAQLQPAIAGGEGDTWRVAWEDPETATISMRSIAGPALGTIRPDLFGVVTTVGDGTASSLVTAPEMRAGTSHFAWRDHVGTGEYAWFYSPTTECGATLCRADEACVAGVCTPR